MTTKTIIQNSCSQNICYHTKLKYLWNLQLFSLFHSILQ